jgi:FkbM family methyltransferase
MEHIKFYEPKHEGVINDIWNLLEYEKYRSLKPDDVVVDAGAGIGIFTVKASLQAKHVYAFEPEPENYGYLKRNVNGLKNVKIFNTALFSNQKIMPLNISQGSWGAHSLFPLPESHGSETVMVQTVRLDDVVHEKVDFLKIDVEASELEMLKGASRILALDKPFIAMEIHNKALYVAVAEYLAAYGYKVCNDIGPTYGTVAFSC